MGKEYVILAADDIDVLTVAVNKSMMDGWVLQGGVSVAVDPLDKADGVGATIFAQAMVKDSSVGVTRGRKKNNS